MTEKPTPYTGFLPWRRSNNDPIKVLFMAVSVGFTCAIVVSSAELLLMPKRQANIDRQREAQMAAMLAVLPGFEQILRESGADSIQTKIVDLTRGEIASDIDPDTFDPLSAESDPTMTTKLSNEIDIAGLGQRANFSPVHLLYRDQALQLVILPVHGTGYQSVIRAWLALSGDLNTIQAFSIYEQGETPGLGSRIEDSAWLAQFSGKQLRDETGVLRLNVAKGQATDEFEIDGISGATRTGNGINNLLAFWLGDAGFGPYLRSLAEGNGQ